MADILVVVEHQEGVFKKNTLSAVSAAKALSGLMGGEVDALELGYGASSVADKVGAESGVRKVLAGESAGAREDSRSRSPSGGPGGQGEGVRRGVFAPASTFGKDFMPRVSGLLDASAGERHRGIGEGGHRCG